MINLKKSYLNIENDWSVVENEYSLETEPNAAALLTTGNGYIGVRGSFEEFGSLRVQGCFIRGLIDQIYELPQPFADNMYMKKYYLHEDKLKHFEKQDSVINFVDILLVRIKIGGETFFPWEGKILSWKRTLDLKNAKLIREVRWENSQGDITFLKFERFASFENDHVYCIKVDITPENHDKEVEILSGLDLRTKTNGQRVPKAIDSQVSEDMIIHTAYAGEAYKFIVCAGVTNNVYSTDPSFNVGWENENDGELLSNKISFKSKMNTVYSLEKKIFVITSRDTENDLENTVKENLNLMKNISYMSLLKKHLEKWSEFFGKLDMKIKGDRKAEVSLRFSNYHTAISICRNDYVHSLGAKGLTGEIYNDFVWWDCEVYQAPPFFYTVPEAAKNILMYRYKMLNSARKLAAEHGRKGARFPFTSSVTGLETVWEYVRHPFMQIHITADVAWGVINYYISTGDCKFMAEYGNEILWEVSRYWASRVEFNEKCGRYEISTVTGTDEHHPYVDNNAYTNYLVCLVLKYAVRMFKEFNQTAANIISKINLSEKEVEQWMEIASSIYLPMEPDTGMIPQFDRYFNLNKELQVSGGSAAKSFQMKESGLYHKSQVIKQPDVMLLFSYINLNFDENIYKRNWNYYEARCEASSSLSYPVHSICASDMGQPESAYKYFMKSARLDMDDEHNCAWQGVHSACAAGAWLSVMRGVAGIKIRENKLEINPHMIPWWEEVSFSFTWHGQKAEVILSNKTFIIKSAAANTAVIPVEFKEELQELEAGRILSFDIAVKSDTEAVFSI